MGRAADRCADIRTSVSAQRRGRPDVRNTRLRCAPPRESRTTWTVERWPKSPPITPPPSKGKKGGGLPPWGLSPPPPKAGFFFSGIKNRVHRTL